MQTLAQPVKLWYCGPLFRHERPQAGRFRQFNQIDAEAIGSDSPLVDAELIILLDELLRELGVPGVRLRLGSLGSPASRAAYREELRAYLRAPRGASSPPSVRERIDENPLRAFDSDDPGTRGGDGGGADDARAPRRRRRRALRRGPARCSTTPGSPTSSTRPWSAGSTTTRGPCSSSSPIASAPRRRSAAAGATTA